MSRIFVYTVVTLIGMFIAWSVFAGPIEKSASGRDRAPSVSSSTESHRPPQNSPTWPGTASDAELERNALGLPTTCERCDDPGRRPSHPVN